MSVFVYILQSLNNGRFYVGSTNNLPRRLEEHRTGQVLATKGILPIELVFSQEYSELDDARRIEYKLKKLKSRKIIERVVKEGRIKLN